MQHQPAVVPAELAMPHSRSPASSKANSPRRARRIQAQPCVVELHQGATRIVHQADGSIVCEPVDTRGRSAPTSPKGLSGSKLGGAHTHELRDRVVNVAADCAIVVSGIGALLGGMVGLFRSMDAMFTMEGGAEPHAVIQAAKTAVQGVALGTLTGAVVAPGTLVVGSLLGVATLARMAVRPALLGVAVHQGVRWVRRHQLGAAAIIRKLQSGDLVKQLEALRRLVARLNASLAFTTQFKRLAGVEVLLGLLERALAAAEAGASALVGPTASLSARALAELSKQGDVTDTIAELDGIPLLVRAAAMGLRGATAPTSPSAGLAASGSPSARSTHSMQAALDSQQGNAALLVSMPCALLVHAMTALSRVTANHAVAQQILTSEPGVPHLVVNALDAATSRSVRGATPAACDELRAQAVTLVQALALEPSTKVELGAAGGVEALSAAFVTAQPWTQGQACAAAALHALVRGEPANQRRLAAVAPAGLSAAINRALVTSAGAVTGIAPNGVPSTGNSTGSGSLPLGGVLSAPVPSQDCHAHRADLLALSNVIARYTAPPPSSPVRAAPAVAAPTPVEAAKPAPTTFLQRLRLRPARATPPARAPAPKAGPAAPTKPAPATGAAAAEAPATGTPVTGMALGAVVPDPAVEPAAVLGAPVAAVAAPAEEDMGVLLHHLMQVNPGAEPSTAAGVGVSESGEADAASSGDQDQDWEKDMGATTSPLKEDPKQPTGQQADEAAEANSA